MAVLCDQIETEMSVRSLVRTESAIIYHIRSVIFSASLVSLSQ